MAEQPRFAGIEFPLRPMIAVAADRLPLDRPGGWAFEPKFDGFRCVAFRSQGRVALQSRQQRPLGRYFPEIVDAVTEVADEVVLDGELVVWHDGHLDFAALQQRVHPSASRASRLAVALPACFVVFDLLARNGVDLRARPYSRRRRVLEKLLDRHLPDRLTLVPMTTDVAAAQLWLVDHCAAGIEGVVAKRLDQAYRPGGRTWRKVRTRTTAEAVVGGVLGPVVQPDALIVGCRDTVGRLRVSGRTTLLSPSARSTMTNVLQPPGASHPWPRTIPSTRFGQLPSEPVPYTRVKPRVVVELDVDAAFEDYRWRHPCRFVRIRRDLKVADLPAQTSRMLNHVRIAATSGAVKEQ
jgi:ATP-dependent DNA ligase